MTRTLLDDLQRLLSDVEPPRRLAFDDVLQLVAGARDAPPPRSDASLHPTATLNGIEIVVSDFLVAGQMVPLGPHAYVVSRADYERVRGRKVLPFPVRPLAADDTGGGA